MKHGLVPGSAPGPSFWVSTATMSAEPKLVFLQGVLGRWAANIERNAVPPTLPGYPATGASHEPGACLTPAAVSRRVGASPNGPGKASFKQHRKGTRPARPGARRARSAVYHFGAGL